MPKIASKGSLDNFRQTVCETMRDLELAGLNRGTAGNVSVRMDHGFLITPSGSKPQNLTAEGIVTMEVSTGLTAGGENPSSEWRFHRAIYAARQDAGAIVHVHSAYATALACQRRPIPSFHYMVAIAGGNSIRCAPYATFGTQALADAVVQALDGRRACLLANHGMIALGQTLAAAFDLAVEVEELARQYALALMSGEPVLLSESEMLEVVEKFKDYGADRG